MREKLTPRYSLGCKRPSFHNEYIRTFNRDNVLLETAAIEEITPSAVRTADGVEHPIDVLVLATGFKVFETGNMPPFVTRGVGGVALEEWWDENRLQAYEGVSVPGFPNWFSILGPYGFNGQSYFGLIETQMRHIVRCLSARPRARRQARRDHPRGQPALLGGGCSAAATTRSSSRARARTPTATTSTSTATRRSGRASASRRPGAAPASTSTTTTSLPRLPRPRLRAESSA